MIKSKAVLACLVTACGGATASSAVAVDGGRDLSESDSPVAKGGADATIAQGDEADSAADTTSRQDQNRTNTASLDAQLLDGGACPYAVFGMPPLFPLYPDAAPHTCRFAPADVACDADTDCATFEIVSCGCYNLIIGVNMSNTAACPAPPCDPPLPGTDPCADGGGWVTQDCQVVVENINAIVSCVDHRCLTRSQFGGHKLRQGRISSNKTSYRVRMFQIGIGVNQSSTPHSVVYRRRRSLCALHHSR